MTKSKLSTFILLAVIVSTSELVIAAEDELRVRLAFRMPVDPLSIISMADYDLALLLSRNWFEYDEGRVATPGIISSWTFNVQLGGYTFKVDGEAMWSDGSKIKSSELIANLRRTVQLNASYGSALKNIIKLDEIKLIDESTLFIATVDGKPSESFFQRMGSIFLAVTNPKDWGTDSKLNSNKISAGPYQLISVTSEEINLERNPSYASKNRKNDNSAKTIKIKKPDTSSNLIDFLGERTWENVVQTTTMLEPNIIAALQNNKLPIWTRGHDRVSLIKPFAGKDIAEQKKFIKFIWKIKEKLKGQKFPLNVKIAKSLQPIGYPLFQEIKIDLETATLPRRKKFKILLPESYSARYHKVILEPLFKEFKFDIEWNFVPKVDFIKALSKNGDNDFALFDFGVADPEIVTWMGLVTKMEFVLIEGKDTEKYEEINKLKDKNLEIERYKEFLQSLASKGSYVPLFHFSTLSIGHKKISFSKIRELDETVDYSKIFFK